MLMNHFGNMYLVTAHIMVEDSNNIEKIAELHNIEHIMNMLNSINDVNHGELFSN